jgi:hypothetical protein
MTKRQTIQWLKDRQYNDQTKKDRQYNDQRTDNTMTKRQTIQRPNEKRQTIQWLKDRKYND